MIALHLRSMRDPRGCCCRYDRDFGAHHMERLDVCHGKRIARRGRSVRKHGTWIQEGKSL